MLLLTRPSISGFRLAATLVLGILIFTLLAAWRADRHDRTQLAADLASANQSLAQATSRQHTREAQLQQALAAIAAQKRITQPAQILRQLPKTIPLPDPVRLQTETAPLNVPKPPCSSGLSGCGRPEGLESTKPRTQPGSSGIQTVALPADDLKPLYDFVLDCQACQAKLAASQADLADEKAKTVVLTRERDEAVRVVKGGGVLRRLERAAKWFLIGAAAGAIAAKAHP